jgi:hypothetical protein
MSALGPVLGRGEVAQSRMAVPAVVLVLEIADHHPRFEQGGPVVAGEALLYEPAVERLDVTVVPRLSGGM